jgi:acyl dehydratase
MGVNTDLEGASFAAPAPYRVSAEAIAAFAAATKATNPAHTDPAAARALGYPDLVAPPTFAVVPSQRAEGLYISSPESGIDFDRVVHGQEQFTYTRPIVAGDELDAVCHVDGIRMAGGNAMITTRTELSSQGEPVVTVTSMIVVRGDDNA